MALVVFSAPVQAKEAQRAARPPTPPTPKEAPRRENGCRPGREMGVTGEFRGQAQEWQTVRLPRDRTGSAFPHTAKNTAGKSNFSGPILEIRDRSTIFMFGSWSAFWCEFYISRGIFLWRVKTICVEFQNQFETAVKEDNVLGIIYIFTSNF